MDILLILVIVVAAGGVIYSLARGLIAFANMSPEDVNEDGVTKSHAKQNKMMFARVKFQLAAIVAVALLMMIAR